MDSRKLAFMLHTQRLSFLEPKVGAFTQALTQLGGTRFITGHLRHPFFQVAQSAGAVEYTDCTSAEG